jgi:hypothetical protein
MCKIGVMISIGLEGIYTLIYIYQGLNEPGYFQENHYFCIAGPETLLFIVILRYGRSTCSRSCK